VKGKVRFPPVLGLRGSAESWIAGGLSPTRKLLSSKASLFRPSRARTAQEIHSEPRWESISWSNGQCGTLKVTHGKTAAARRMLPMSPRVRATLERRWEAAQMPPEGWVWAAATASGHVEPSSVKKQHRRAQRLSGFDRLCCTPCVIRFLRGWARQGATLGPSPESLVTPQFRCQRGTSTRRMMP